MKPEEIEELMHNLNAPKITVAIPGESENGDEPDKAEMDHDPGNEDER